MFSKYVAGVSYSDNVSQIVVLQMKRKGARIRSIHEFRKQSDSPAWFLGPLIGRSEKIFRKVKTVAVAIDHDRLLFRTFPVDAGLNRPAMREHAAWEFAQFLPEGSAQAYVGDVYPLESRTDRPITDALYVAARRDFVQVVEQEIKKARFKCGQIDAAYFGAESSGLLNHPELGTVQSAIIGLFRRTLVVGILADGRLVQFVSKEISDPTDVLPHLEIEFGRRPVESICIYGPAAVAAVLNAIRARFSCEVAYLHAFKALEVDFDRRAMQQFMGREHVFASCVGIALRSA